MQEMMKEFNKKYRKFVFNEFEKTQVILSLTVLQTKEKTFNKSARITWKDDKAAKCVREKN